MKLLKLGLKTIKIIKDEFIIIVYGKCILLTVSYSVGSCGVEGWPEILLKNACPGVPWSLGLSCKITDSFCIQIGALL